LVLFVSGLVALLNPERVHRQNADVPGSYKTGFAWVSVPGWRFAGAIMLGLSGIFIYLFFYEINP